MQHQRLAGGHRSSSRQSERQREERERESFTTKLPARHWARDWLALALTHRERERRTNTGSPLDSYENNTRVRTCVAFFLTPRASQPGPRPAGLIFLEAAGRAAPLLHLGNSCVCHTKPKSASVKNGGVPSTARSSHSGGRASGTRHDTDKDQQTLAPSASGARAGQ